MKPIIIHPSYFPPTTYLAAILQNEGNVLLEAEDHFQKQTFRNRTIIGTDKGPLSLSIPVRHQKGVRQK
ncbi:MAG: WbqC family protein, partial [Bacteroidetes bacterium]|nr:WbqC family protein [Bacteroidota bacterium]